jgi:hypothetical protein
MKAVESPYYPARAGRFGRGLHGWFRFRRALHRPRPVPPPPALSRPRLVLWLLVPGSLTAARGKRLRGGVLLSLWLAMIAACWIWIGTAWSSSALVVASALHSLTAAIALAAWLEHVTPGSRLRRAAWYAFLLVLLLYMVAVPALTRRVVLVINVRDDTHLINPSVAPGELRRGDWIAYQFYSHSGAMGFDRILALPGETIRFYNDAFEVGGTAYQRLPRMPTAGEKRVGEGEYFVWPAGARLNGFAGRGEGTRLLQGAAIVPEKRVLGRAYDRWLWRKQTLDPLVVLKDWTPPSLPP